MVFSRNSRSCRKRPAVTSALRSALVAEISRTLTLRVFDDPSRSNSPVSMTRSSFGLLAERHVGDLVEEERAAVGELEAADAIDLGVGERALHVAEELGLEHALGHAAGVDRDHRPVGARRHRVQRLRDQPLAGAVLAGDQHVGVRRADARDDVEHRPHRRRFGEQRRMPVGHQRLVGGFELPAAADRAARARSASGRSTAAARCPTASG